MVPELKDLTYEERLREMSSPTLQERRERGDMITMYKMVNHIEKIDRQDLVMVTGGVDRRTRGHSKKIVKSQCLRKYSFPHRTVDVWNDLSEVVTANSVYTFKEKVDKYSYGDRTSRETYIHTHTHIYTHTYTHTHIQIHTHKLREKKIDRNTHTHTRTYVHTHTCISVPFFLNFYSDEIP